MIRLREGEIHLWRLGAMPGGARSVCARYVDRPFALERSPLGKPYVSGGDIEIGVSHTEGATVVAVSRRAVGIDIERMGPLPDLDALAAASLGAGEARELEVLVGRERAARFYRFWVRKEALLKARGCGLAVDPREVDTTRGVTGWQWIDATLEPGFAVSVATAEPSPRLRWMTS
jgi:phosphopantetheinyl transferase